MKEKLQKILIILCISLVGMLVIGQVQNVFAGTSVGSIGTLRESQTNSTNGGIANRVPMRTNYGQPYCYNTFCMKNGPILRGGMSGFNSTEIYNKSDLVNKSALQWLFDNIYLDYTGGGLYGTTGVNVNNTELLYYKKNLADIVALYYSNIGKTYDYNAILASINALTDGEIFRAEQMSIWRFTNNSTLSDNMATLNTVGIQKDLYYALKSIAETKQAAGYISPNASPNTRITTINKNSAKLQNNSGLIGPFTISNNNSLFQKDIKVLVSQNYGAEVARNFKIVNAQGTEISGFRGNMSNGNNSYNGEFYIKVVGMQFDPNITITVNIDFGISGYITTGKYWTKNNIQPLVTIERENITKNFRASFTQYPTNLDLALKKSIISVKDGVTGQIQNYNRKSTIDTSPLDNEKGTNALYSMEKSPVKVKVGDIVTYEIKVYNESTAVAAAATEIVDYLPTGVVLATEEVGAVTANSGKIEYTYSENKKYIKIKYTDTETIAPYTKGGGSSKLYGRSIFVKCKISQDANVEAGENNILTNVAEITKYGYISNNRYITAVYGQPVSTYINDRDSVIANWQSPNKTGSEYELAVLVPTNAVARATYAWRNYSNAQKEWVIEGGFHNFLGQQDDDDFEKLEIMQPDLALRKFIVSVENSRGKIDLDPDNSGATEYSERRLASVAGELLEIGATDAEYLMTKTPREVEIGDVVTYGIRIFNEGKIDAKASEVIDYLPEGLTFRKAYIKSSGSTEKVEILAPEAVNGSILGNVIYDSEKNEVILKYNSDLLNAFSEIDGLDYYTFYVECEVNANANGVQTNVAEITEYTIEGNRVITKDIDSISENFEIEGIDKNLASDRLKALWYSYANGRNDDILRGAGGSDIYAYWIGQEDDDDFEKIYTKVQGFDLALRKAIVSVTANPGETTETVTQYDNAYSNVYDTDAQTRIAKRAQTVTADSWLNFYPIFGGMSTLEYYHAKDAVTVEKGNVVKYSIRVYNEGDLKGKVLKVGDYLPKGYELTQGSTINTEYGWTYTTGYSPTEAGTNGFVAIETTLATENVLDAVDVINKNVDYLELMVECTITDTAETNKYYTNLAEIKEAVALDSSDGELPEIKDFDSVYNSIFEELSDLEASEVQKKLDNYYISYILGGIENYENSGMDALAQTYFPGVEDDDDSETVFVYEDITRTYNLKLIKIDSETGDTLNGIKFNVTGVNQLNQNLVANSNEANEVELDPELYTTATTIEPVTYDGKTYNDGIIEINNIEVKEFEKHRFIFEETEIPTLYNYDLTSAGIMVIFGKDSEGKITPRLLLNTLKTDIKISYDFDTNTIIIIVKNTPKGKYDLNIQKTDDDGDAITSPLEFRVTYPDNIQKILRSEDGTLKIVDDKEIEEPGTDIYKIKETIGPEGYVLDPSEITVTVEKYYDIVNHCYSARVVSVVNENDLDKEYQYINTPAGTGTIISTSTVMLPNAEMTGDYQIRFKKVDADEPTKVLGGVSAVMKVLGNSTKVTTNATTGISDAISVLIDNGSMYNVNVIDEVNVSEIDLGEYAGKYSKIISTIPIYVKKGIVDDTYKATDISLEKDYEIYSKEYTLENGEKVIVEVSLENNVITLTIPNKKIVKPDLALQKFITGVTTSINDKTEVVSKDIKDRVPSFSKNTNVTDKDGYTYKPYFDDLKPVEVNPTDIVTYTLRIYNEGEMDAYAAEIADDIPEGVEFVPYTADEADTSINKQYRWVMYKVVTDEEIATLPEGTVVKELDGVISGQETKFKKCIITTDVKEADYIVTDYLSKEQGEARMKTGDIENPNLLTAFEPTTEEKLAKGPDYRDLKIQFKVTYIAKSKEEADKVIINYAQITKETDEDGEPIIDRDSTENEWIEEDDDQDREKIKVNYFDLSLVKWVSEAIIVQDGVETTQPGNKFEDLENKDDHRLIFAMYPKTIEKYTDLEPVVKVDIAKNKLKNTVVKFKYQIRVCNEGNIDGYAKEITDYIPTGMRFVQEDNPLWKDVGDGKVVTNQLDDTLLTVGGEPETVEIVYTWINSEDNLGLIVNMAEISKDHNEYGVPDIDSTPGNIEVGEDDIDDAAVLLSVRTGEIININYIILAVATVSLISVGIILIKKFL